MLGGEMLEDTAAKVAALADVHSPPPSPRNRYTPAVRQVVVRSGQMRRQS
jgi:hypothetical protein